MESRLPPSDRTVLFQAVSVPSRVAPPRAEPPSVLGESHIQLRVTDLDRSSRFYTDIVGLREHVRTDVQVILTCGTWNLGLIATIRRGRHDNRPPRNPYEVDRAGLQHLAFALGSVAEVDAAGDWLDRQQVRHKPVSNGHTPGSRYVTFYDPDGIPLEFYYLDASQVGTYGLEPISL